MRVLLLGATGNLGSRCLPALVAHKHVVIVFVRNSSKLRAMMSPALLAEANAIVEGDATDSAALEKAILDHDIEGIIDVAGNIVPPWKEFLLPKIASAVRDAAVAVGKQRGKPLRAWITSHLGILEYPGTSYLIQNLYDIHFLL
jgi:putative NADH-flavin reductase